MEPNMSLWFTLQYWKDLKICHFHLFKHEGLWMHIVGLNYI